MPTDEEDAAIQRGIDQDPDNPEWTDEMFARARPAREMMPPALYAELTAPKRARGPGKTPAKVVVSFRLPPDVAADLRAIGPGWQKQASDALARLAARRRGHGDVHRPLTAGRCAGSLPSGSKRWTTHSISATSGRTARSCSGGRC